MKKITRNELRKLIMEAVSSSVKTGQYTVKKGDTLESITKRVSPEGVTVEDNKKLNPKIKDWSKLQLGQSLSVYVVDEYEGGND